MFFQSLVRAFIGEIIEYLGCGMISTRTDSAVFVVYKFNDILDKIVPFLQSYPLQGVKSMDYMDFCRVAKL